MGSEAWQEAALVGQRPFGLRWAAFCSLPSPFVVKPILQHDAVNRCNVSTAPGERPRPRAVWNHTSLKDKLFLRGWVVVFMMSQF